MNVFTEKYDVVMSDMAANTTGNKDIDHIRTSTLVEEAFNFSLKVCLSNSFAFGGANACLVLGI